MATLIRVGHTIVNLDTITTIELEVRAALAPPRNSERVIRIYFATPAGCACTAGTIAPAGGHRVLELRGDDAAAFRRYLEYEAIDVTSEQALECA